jgi:hypothetical protein
MPRFSASVATTGLALFLSAAAATAQTQGQIQSQTHPLVSVSKVRIVRLSDIRGAVQLDRSNGHGFEQAIANLPVVEQNRLKTAVGVAEVEFEDNSTLRLGPNSEADFLLLGRTDQGATVSSVRLVRGTAYASLVKSGGKTVNAFDLAFGDKNIQLQPDTHVRLEMNDQQAKLAVLNGSVHVNLPDGAIEVSRKNTATFALAGNTQPAVAKNVATESLDAWDKQQNQFHSVAASFANTAAAPYSYGLSDMAYYGAFADMGCGTMWRPYFTSAAWDPYSNGTWAYYTGTGYSWVSPYPWAWTPYHYGSWSFCPGAGWGWMPGGSWMGLNNMVAATGPVENPVKGKGPGMPVAPPPPRDGESSLVTPKQTATVHSGIVPSGSFVFRRDSAGLGIPRGELGNLKSFSERAVQKGEATAPVYFSAGDGDARAANGFHGVGNTLVPVAIHRGTPPEPSFPASGFSSGVQGTTRTMSSGLPNATAGPAPAAGGAHR